MLDPALVLSGVLMGAAGAPHCAAMCGVSSTALTRRCGGRNAPTAFHVGRVAGYAAVGALAASSAGLLAQLGETAPYLRPLWTLLQVAAAMLGLWLMVTARQPAWMSAQPRVLSPQLVREGWQSLAGPARAAVLGTAWVAWPCGLLQSALIVATLASTPLAGGLVMGGFALTSATGLLAVPWLWARAGGRGQVGALSSQWAVRVSGACLLAASGWALSHGLWERVSAFCGLG
jgi:sulfite exporter TauE/SafE